MAEKFSFFTSLNGDRKYKATDFAEYFSTFIGNGVFPNPSTNLQVVSNSDMTVSIKEGFAWINGYMYHNTDDLILTLDHADGVLKRIDRVVVRLDFINREITCKIKSGTFDSAPTAPGLQRDSDIYELGIADILVDNGVISISQSNITDTRLNSELCGIVTQTVKNIDTTTLYNQLEAWKSEEIQNFNSWRSTQEDLHQEWYTTTTEQLQVDFQTWFESIKGILDGDTLGNLLGMIGDLQTLYTTNKDSLVSAINEVFQSGVNAKEGMIQAINSKKTVSEVTSEDNWDTITQRVIDIKEGSGNATVGDVIAGKTFTNDDGIEYTGTLNIGGTAAVGDVLAGKTFTDDSKIIKTGTMVNRGGAQTITPGTSNKVLGSGYYSGNITVKGDVNLIAGNIATGKSIFGVAGSANTIYIGAYTSLPSTGREGELAIITPTTGGRIWFSKDDISVTSISDGDIYIKDQASSSSVLNNTINLQGNKHIMYNFTIKDCLQRVGSSYVEREWWYYTSGAWKKRQETSVIYVENGVSNLSTNWRLPNSTSLTSTSSKVSFSWYRGSRENVTMINTQSFNIDNISTLNLSCTANLSWSFALKIYRVGTDELLATSETVNISNSVTLDVSNIYGNIYFAIYLYNSTTSGATITITIKSLTGKKISL